MPERRPPSRSRRLRSAPTHPSGRGASRRDRPGCSSARRRRPPGAPALRSPRTDSRTAHAAADKGTPCSTPIFMRSAGIRHSRASRSISFQVARRASLDPPDPCTSIVLVLSHPRAGSIDAGGARLRRVVVLGRRSARWAAHSPAPSVLRGGGSRNLLRSPFRRLCYAAAYDYPDDS